ncbi:MAG TPA: VWA domain-containing protein, partial [Candidatus Ozemobacteraceae bacterium]|nr:VWA domain-containing protein [Candidatus Ozemobacteraceae bacterium]
ACDRLYSNSDPRDFRTMILFTDGRDETPVTRQQMSIRSLDEALNFARKKQVRIIAVGMGDQIDQNILKKLSSETGGWYMYAPKAQALFAVYERISTLMKAEKHFQLAYQSPNQDRNGEKREIRVTVQTPSGPHERQLDYTAPLPLKTKPVSTIGIAMPGDPFGTTTPPDASAGAQVSQPAQPVTPVEPPKPAFEIKIREGQQTTGLDLPPFPDAPPASDTPTGQFR